MINAGELVRLFRDRFGQAPRWVVRAPGRVNLIGEHTDYNEGFVMPLAIEHAVWIALAPRDDRRVVVESLDFGGRVEFPIDEVAAAQPGSGHPLQPSHRSGQVWPAYIAGVTWSLAQDGWPLRGWEGLIHGDVPIGAGLSSSAAIEVATAYAFAASAGWEPKVPSLARACQRAENQWVGVGCGIMDQLVSLAGKKGHAILIDCRSLEYRPVILPAEVVVVIMDTGTRRGLADSEYNSRRSQCEEAARLLGVRALRDIGWDNWPQCELVLPEPWRRRARHVVSENHRTLQAVEAMEQRALDRLGRLLVESHQSLRDDFEVSSPALDTIVAIAQAQPGCFGARMTGAGFGGCAIALVEAARAREFAQSVEAEYRRRTNLEPKLYVSAPAYGAQILSVDELSPPGSENP
ncbi:MAG: galactokinase [Thermoguttaceae bacterium]|nr:galactokinase [Thermoguttaceae bacterium]MDW8077309.1 galactokinase [Thermoguttaceae bacterium]